jgi:uncharacterized protein (PEP-CTERM system associated)
MSNSCVRLLAIVFAATTVAEADRVFAQESGSASGGWVLTPSLTYSTGWDDNVLIRGEGDSTPGDFLNVLNPRADIRFHGRRGQFDVNYDGAILLYHDLSTLNSYDQRAAASASRRISPQLSLFVRNSFALVPTTQTVELVGVPFLRTGSTVDDLQSGVEAILGKHTTLTAAYAFQWVRFDSDPIFAAQLHGGYSNGASISLRRGLSSRSAVVVDADFQHALVTETNETFVVQNVIGGIHHQLSRNVRVFGMAGVSHLNVSASGPSNNTGPSFSAGVGRQFQAASGGLTYSQSFIPTYGFGGTMQNQELTGHLSLPLSRRLSQQSSVSWRRNESLVEGEPSLRSLWFTVALGYALHPAVRIEGFYDLAHQVIDRAGGVTNRNRLGFQLVTAKPVRIR